MKITVECVYKPLQGTESYLHSDEMSVQEAILLAEDLEQTGRIQSISFSDEQGTRWTMKELKKYNQSIQKEPHEITIYFDGGFDVKTKQAGLGCVIYYEQNNEKYRIRRNALTLGLQSNNEAEYAAFHLCVKELEYLDVKHLPIICKGDSIVVMNQLSGDWPCYEESFIKWIDRIERKFKKLGITPMYEKIQRTKNKEADKLASQALKGIDIFSTQKINRER